ncbi:hypothetical protein BDF14DRAFT_1788840 [Spinellus fusiger]|nr:hypothetical protein BDF14DRAFT_1788840 [Spinellus fusiger]
MCVECKITNICITLFDINHCLVPPINDVSYIDNHLTHPINSFGQNQVEPQQRSPFKSAVD